MFPSSQAPSPTNGTCSQSKRPASGSEVFCPGEVTPVGLGLVVKPGSMVGPVSDILKNGPDVGPGNGPPAGPGKGPPGGPGKGPEILPFVPLMLCKVSIKVPIIFSGIQASIGKRFPQSRAKRKTIIVARNLINPINLKSQLQLTLKLPKQNVDHI